MPLKCTIISSEMGPGGRGERQHASVLFGHRIALQTCTYWCQGSAMVMCNQFAKRFKLAAAMPQRLYLDKAEISALLALSVPWHFRIRHVCVWNDGAHLSALLPHLTRCLTQALTALRTRGLRSVSFQHNTCFANVQAWCSLAY